MRQRLGFILTITLVIVLLVVLNAASYTSAEREPDTEFNADRSTYNAGGAGTRALYDFLAESGREVTRWHEQPYALSGETGDRSSPTTFVVVGRTRIAFDEDEAKALLRWVERGGRLVLIDRRPDARLLPPSQNWNFSAQTQLLPRTSVRSNNAEEMTAGVSPVRPRLVSAFVSGVEAVMPSRYAGAIRFFITESAPAAAQTSPTPTPTPTIIEEESTEGVEEEERYEEAQPPPPPPKATPGAPASTAYTNETLLSPAPVAHLEDHRGALLIDYPHGAGRIIVLSDPFIVANGGLRLADNLRLALNTVAGQSGLIAFDEYHQGHAAPRNQLVAYFAGTPVLWMLAQGLLIVLVVLWTRGRRFARPLPVERVDRRSSLEFVASMAELQQRARAYDLAIENIYTRLRRVLVRYAGLSHNSPRSEIAARVAARSEKLNGAQLEILMQECEEAINGAPLDKRKSLELVRRLREVERTLGLRLRSRETRQAAEGLKQNSL